MSKQSEYEHKLVIDRVICAIHDYGTRYGATSSFVIKALKSDGFTVDEIRESLERMV